MTSIRKFMFPESKKYLTNIFLILLLTVLALYARKCLFPITSRDYYHFLVPWYEQLKNNGGFAAIGMSIGDYTPMYYYILAILTYIPLNSLAAIKLVSCIADVILAVLGYKIVNEVTGDSTKSLVAYGTLLFMPSVILNSAAWGQCDAIFTLFILASIYFLLKNRDWAAAICFSISFSFKIQAIFFAPVLLVLLIKRKIRVRTVLALPAVYILSITPAWIAGGNFYRLLTIYLRQPLQYSILNMYIQNAWALVKDIDSDELGKAGIFFAGGVVILSLFWICRSKFRFRKETIIIFSGFYTLLLPFILPYMHERYYYLPAVIIAIYAIINFENIWAFLIMEFCLFQAEIHNLFGKEAMDFNFSFILVTVVLLHYVRAVYKLLNEPDDIRPEITGTETDKSEELICKSEA